MAKVFSKYKNHRDGLDTGWDGERFWQNDVSSFSQKGSDFSNHYRFDLTNIFRQAPNAFLWIIALLLLIVSFVNTDAGYTKELKKEFLDTTTASEDLYGFVDKTGKFVIPPKFRWANSFSEGLAAVQVGQNLGYINHRGEFVISPKFFGARAFHHGRALACPSIHQYRLIDKSGNLKGDFDAIWITEEPCDELITFGDHKGLWGCIDLDGNVIIEPKYDHLDKLGHDMLAVASGDCLMLGCGHKAPPSNQRELVKPLPPPFGTHDVPAPIKPAKFGVINYKGETIIDPRYDSIAPLSAQALFFKKDGKWGTMKISGEVILEPEFKDVNVVDIEKMNSYPGWKYVDQNISSRPSEEMAIAEVVEGNKEKFVYVGSNGKIAITRRFDDALPFSQGLAPVAILGPTKSNSKRKLYGYINKSGEMIIAPKFDSARLFSEGFASIKQGTKWGSIDKHGHYLARPQFDLISDFSDGVVFYKIGNILGIINCKGAQRSFQNLATLRDFSEGVAVAQRKTKTGS